MILDVTAMYMQDKVSQCKTRTKETKGAIITFRAPESLAVALRAIAIHDDRSLAYVCVKALTDFVTTKQSRSESK